MNMYGEFPPVLPEKPALQGKQKGRPKKADEDVKDDVVHFRCSKALYAKLEEGARQNGLSSVDVFAREYLLSRLVCDLSLPQIPVSTPIKRLPILPSKDRPPLKRARPSLDMIVEEENATQNKRVTFRCSEKIHTQLKKLAKAHRLRSADVAARAVVTVKLQQMEREGEILP